MEVYSWENLIELNGDLIFSSKPCLITGCIWWWMEGANESLGAMVVSSFSPKKVREPRNYNHRFAATSLRLEEKALLGSTLF